MNSDDTRIRLALEATRVAYDKGHAFAVKQGSGPGEAHLMGLMTVANAIEQVLGEQTIKLLEAKASVEMEKAGAKKKWEEGVVVLTGLLEAFDKIDSRSWSYAETKRVGECSELVEAALKVWKESF